MARYAAATVLAIMVVGLLGSCENSNSVWWRCKNCSLYKASDAVRAGDDNGSASVGTAPEVYSNEPCDYNGWRYDPMEPVGYGVLRFEIGRPYEYLKNQPGSEEWWKDQDMVLIASSWHDFFAYDGGLGKFGHDFPSATMVHVVDPDTDAAYLVWKGSYEDFRDKSGYVPPSDPRWSPRCGGTTASSYKTYGIDMCEKIRDYCNPPCSIGLTITDSNGKSKEVQLLMQ